MKARLWSKRMNGLFPRARFSSWTKRIALERSANALFADDKRPIAAEADRELKRRKIDNTNLCNGSHCMFLLGFI
jgi:hypothetical protein